MIACPPEFACIGRLLEEPVCLLSSSTRPRTCQGTRDGIKVCTNNCIDLLVEASRATFEVPSTYLYVILTIPAKYIVPLSVASWSFSSTGNSDSHCIRRSFSLSHSACSYRWCPGRYAAHTTSRTVLLSANNFNLAQWYSYATALLVPSGSCTRRVLASALQTQPDSPRRPLPQNQSRRASECRSLRRGSELAARKRLLPADRVSILD